MRGVVHTHSDLAQYLHTLQGEEAEGGGSFLNDVSTPMFETDFSELTWMEFGAELRGHTLSRLFEQG